MSAVRYDSPTALFYSNMLRVTFVIPPERLSREGLESADLSPSRMDAFKITNASQDPQSNDQPDWHNEIDVGNMPTSKNYVLLTIDVINRINGLR